MKTCGFERGGAIGWTRVWPILRLYFTIALPISEYDVSAAQSLPPFWPGRGGSMWKWAPYPWEIPISRSNKFSSDVTQPWFMRILVLRFFPWTICQPPMLTFFSLNHIFCKYFVCPFLSRYYYFLARVPSAPLETHRVWST